MKRPFKRRERDVKIRRLSALLIPMLLIPIAGFGYAHWTDSVTKQVKLHVAERCSVIISYKCLSEFNDDLIGKDPPDDEVPQEGISTLRIWTDEAFPGWWLWIGFLIQNQGRFRVEVNVPEYTVIMQPPDSPSPTTTEYFYRPYTTEDWKDAKKDIWDGINWKYFDENGHVAPGVPVGPPVFLEQYGPSTENRMVIWIHLAIDGNPEGEAFELDIEITLPETLVTP